MQANWAKNDPVSVALCATSWRICPNRDTGAPVRLHDTVPESVTTPVPEPTEPRVARFKVMSHGAITVTANYPVALFPDASVATQSTFEVPIGNVLPDWGEQFTDGLGSTLSVAVTV